MATTVATSSPQDTTAQASPSSAHLAPTFPAADAEHPRGSRSADDSEHTRDSDPSSHADDKAPSTALAHPAPSDSDRFARAALSRVIEPGDPAALTTFAGLTPLEIWDLLHSTAPGLERWSTRLPHVDPARDLDRAHAAGGRFIIPGDDEWPDQLEVLTDAGQQSRRGGVPFGLWVRGTPNLRELLANSVAIVGARACSSYGEHTAAELAAGLGDHGTAVVSGGAYGIDAAAHRGALASSGTTIAVLACGVDVSYPKRNSALFDRIAAEGLLLSELPPGCSPTKLRFLARNRLIAAATLGTVVVEAAIRSGALNSAGWAEQCGRAVLAVPGAVTSRMSEGAHLLIRERNATLATSVADILEAISPLGEHLTTYPHAAPTPIDALDHDLRRTLDAVPVLRPAPAHRIAITAGLDLATVQECLETLDQAHLIEYTPTGWHLTRQTPDL
ncbi:DNA protecting protein DprA [Kribbella flavida DSM 17836]|uniref:DNA protecting protein DprA n=1 Tax=Kribbella flavida (strain DSM 17836 / JCM 10339 / NBRC 14399) TaxID=479435 RepID=D2PZG0_KRIFD|nr:DNA protecting protein DprA [Kribbella flavida DSM 17836]